MNITCWFLLSFVSLQYIFASAHVFVRVDWKSALAGGLAGGIATSIIFPIDTVKTMLQTNPRITTLSGVLEHLKAQSFGRIYSGFFPAVLGSILSSSLYFGTYEATKSFMYARCNLTNRHFIHGIAATTGNIASSFVFVPKETIKQQLQAFKTGTLRSKLTSNALTSVGIAKHIIRNQGMRGLYPSYRATLARNIPSAAIRFTVFEELKIRLLRRLDRRWHNIGLLVAGGLASGLSSLATTPFDVVKTRLSTGLLPPGSHVLKSLVQIARQEGVSALYAGMQARILWSTLYGAIGLTTFELSKKLLSLQSTESTLQYK